MKKMTESLGTMYGKIFVPVDGFRERFAIETNDASFATYEKQ